MINNAYSKGRCTSPLSLARVDLSLNRTCITTLGSRLVTFDVECKSRDSLNHRQGTRGAELTQLGEVLSRSFFGAKPAAGLCFDHGGHLVRRFQRCLTPATPRLRLTRKRVTHVNLSATQILASLAFSVSGMAGQRMMCSRDHACSRQCSLQYSCTNNEHSEQHQRNRIPE